MLMELGQQTTCKPVLWSQTDHAIKLLAGFIQTTKQLEGSSEPDARSDVAGMVREARLEELDRTVMMPELAMGLRQREEQA